MPSATTKTTTTTPSVPPKPVSARKSRALRRRGRAPHHGLDSDEEIEREAVSDDESSHTDSSSLDSETDSDTEPVSEDAAATQSRVLSRSATQTPVEDHPSAQPTKEDAVGNGVSFFAAKDDWSEMVTAAENNAGSTADDLPVIDFHDLEAHVPKLKPTKSAKNRTAKKAKQPLAPPTPAAAPPQPNSTLSLSTYDHHRRNAKGEYDFSMPVPGSVYDDPKWLEGLDPDKYATAPQEPSDEQGDNSASASTSKPLETNNSPSTLARHGHSRPQGQTARQAYQRRLESDPSYVPTVGEFWGHDDRLLDKDLRSLSGWWRGRWMGRGGRGRGTFDRGFMRGRGRGGANVGHHNPGAAPSDEQEDVDAAAAAENNEGTAAEADLPPVEKQWTHDGFEELKKKDEIRRMIQQRQQESLAARGGTNFRGSRGGFTARGGRGGSALSRGGAHAPSSQTHAGSTQQSSQPQKVWYAQRPDYMWTKQQEAFLFFEPSLKPKHGQGPGYRVKLPGQTSKVVRGSIVERQDPAPATSKSEDTAGAPAPDDGERLYVVRLPGDKKNTSEKPPPQVSPIPEVEEVLEVDPFVVRPELQDRSIKVEIVPPAPAVAPEAAEAAPSSMIASTILREPEPRPALIGPQATSPLGHLQGLPEHAPPQPSPEHVMTMPPPLGAPEPSSFGVDPYPPAGALEPPALPPIQTSFTPIPHHPGSPFGSGSPYGYAAPPTSLPPGIALDQHGMPYELATGRHVYLPAPPPPPPSAMYHPQPVMPAHMPHGARFMPAGGHGHVRHPSALSVEYIPSPAPMVPQGPPPQQQQQPQTPTLIDPSTGAPIFAYPKKSSRIEIKRPDGSRASVGPSVSPVTVNGRGGIDGKHERRISSSGLRMSANAFTPAWSGEGEEQGIINGGDDRSQEQGVNGVPPEQQQMMYDPTAAGMVYSPYHTQSYYYPTEPYSYPAYPDMSMQQGYPPVYGPDYHQGAAGGPVYY
jgi:hypothetical protein